MAKKTTPGKELTKWEEQAKAEAAQIAEAEAFEGGTTFIKTQGGMLVIGDEPVPDNAMRVVIVDSVRLNTYYLNKYNADSPESPTCYAFCRTSEDPKTMGPHEKAEDPQADACEGCDWNEYASAETGRGKACGNTRRLAVIAEGDLDDIENATVMYMKVPVTSVQFWKAYVKDVQAKIDMPPYAVVTEVELVKHPKHQFHMLFTFCERIDRKLLGSVMELRESIAEDIVAPFATNAEIKERQEEAQPVRRKAPPKGGKAKGKGKGKY